MLLARRSTLWVAALVPLFATGTPLAQSEWGLRNVDKLTPLGWTAEDFSNQFGAHGAGTVAFWTFWGQLQSPTSGDCTTSTWTYDFGPLDELLDFAIEVAADPVIVLHASKGFGQPAIDAWGTPMGGTGPCDLQESYTAQYPPPSELTGSGYSVMLFDLAEALAEHFVQIGYQGTVYLRFHNEPWDLWTIGTTTPEQELNLDNYLRCYSTFRWGVESVSTPGIDFRFGHGSIPRGRLVPEYYYGLAIPAEPQGDGQTGTPPPQNAGWIMTRLNAYTERIRSTINTLYGVTLPFNSWEEVVNYADPGVSENQKLDAWMDAMVEWTAAGYFDFTTQHPHGKPYFLELEQSEFETRVIAAGGSPPPWLAAEAAFEMLDPAGWGVMSTEGPAYQAFVAEDSARKWCTLAGSSIRFCTPIVGGPHPKYVGLWAPGECFKQLCPLPGDGVFEFLSGKTGEPDGIEVLSSGPNAIYRFDQSSSGEFVDVAWRRTLFDASTATADVTFDAPAGYTNPVVSNVFEEPLSTWSFANDEITLFDLGQSPRVIVWSQAP